MAYHFRMVGNGNGFRHSWTKECSPEDALHHAQQLAREFEPDECYRTVSICVSDDDGNDIGVVPVMAPT